MDLLFVHGWKSIIHAVNTIMWSAKTQFLNLKSQHNDDSMIMFMKTFIKNCNLKSILSNIQMSSINDRDLSSLGNKIYSVRIPNQTLSNLSKNDFDIFSTYEGSGNAMNLLPKSNDDTSEQLEKAFEDSFTISEIHNGNVKVSDDDSERKGYGTAQAEDAKFLIPNEGNINKSPLSLLTKATNVFAVGTNGQVRDKSRSFQSYKRYYGKRSTTPQNRNQIKANLINSEKVHFESVKPKEVERPSQRFGILNTSSVVPRLSRHTKRSHTIKSRVNQINKNNISRVLETNQRMLPQLRQSIEPTSHHMDQEDFLFNDIDEKVSSNK